MPLIEGPVDALPLPDDCVDVAVANMVLHHAPHPAAMVAEMARVVRAGGRIAIIAEMAHEYEWMRTEQADLWLGFTPDQVARSRRAVAVAGVRVLVAGHAMLRRLTDLGRGLC